MSKQLDMQDVLDLLDGVQVRSRNGVRAAQARCPAHDDRDPSLSITEGQTCILLYCHAGCSFESIVAALGIDQTQLLYELTGPTGVPRKPAWVREAEFVRQLNLEGDQ